MYAMGDEEFEQAIEEALETIPEQFLSALEDLAIVMRDEPEGLEWHGELLGLYDGIPLTERNDIFDVEIPDVITIFKGPHERSFSSHDEIVREIAKTVIHEIGHYFGLDDDRLHEMGY